MPQADRELSMNDWIEVVPDVQAWRYGTISACSLFAYDMILSWDNEYQHIWKPKWSYSTFLYFLSRYPWFIVSVVAVYLYEECSNPRWTCDKAVTFHLYCAVVHITLVQFILALRTYAIYDRKKWLFIILCLLIAGGSGIEVWLVASTVSRVPPSDFPSPLLAGCFLGFTSCQRMSQWFWVPLGIFELIVCCLTVFRAYLHSKSKLHRTPILHILYRDGFLYFAVIFSFEIVNLLLWNFVPQNVSQSFAPFLGTIHGIMCPRLLLNLRTARPVHLSALSSSSPSRTALTTTWFKPANNPVNKGESGTFISLDTITADIEK